jgi:hypothetical protein
MSIICHFPLNGDTLDYSGNANHAVNYNAVISDNGKIGKCYSFNGTTSYINNEIKLLKSNSKFSMCCWMKTGETFTYNVGIIGFGYSPIITMTPAGTIYCWWYDGVSYPSLLSTKKCNDNVFHHIAMTYDGSVVKLYIDGIEECSRSVTKIHTEYTGIEIGREHNAGNKIFKGLINDAKFYDHALSLSEIKEVYKTKILHYTFDEKVQLLPNEFTYPTFETVVGEGGWSHWGRTGSIGTHGQNIDRKYIYGDQMYSHWVANAASGTGEYLFYQAPEYPGGYRSLQAIIKVDDSTLLSYPDEKICFPAWNGRNGGVPLDMWTSIEYLRDGFFLCKCEGISQDGTNDLVGIFVKPGYKIYVSKARLEQSQFCSDIFNESDNIIADSSGYGNHSLPAANHIPKWSNDSKLGSGALSFNYLTEYIKTPPVANLVDGITFAAWFKSYDITKPQNIFSANPSYFVRIVSSKMRWSIYANGTWTFGTGSTTLLSNIWYNVVMVYDKTTLKGYVNGVLDYTLDLQGRVVGSFGGVMTIGYTTGGEDSPFYGLIDDISIYATPLNVEDIKELYETKLTVDTDKNNIFVGEVIENQNLFDLDYIYEYGKRLNIHGFCNRATIFGVPCVGIGAAVFYKVDVDIGNVAPNQINMVNNFKPNTRYLFDIIVYNTCYYNGNIPGGLVITYSDSTQDHFLITSVYKRWIRLRGVSQAGKSVKKVSTYYHTGDYVYYSYDSKIVEYKEPDINIKSQISCSELIEVKPYKPTLVDYSIWNQLGKGSIGPWIMNGAADENERLIAGNPYGEPDYMWMAPGNDIGSDADGGFDHSYVGIDKTKKYRVSMWMRRENPVNGRLYLGCANNAISLLGSTVAVSNPYFHHSLDTGDEWFLWVAHIHPYDFTGTVNDDKSGLYDITGRKRFNIANDFKWLSTATTNTIRAYMYYSTSLDEMAYFYRPRFEVCDGSEPSLEELIACTEHSSLFLSGMDDISIDQYGNIFSNQIIEN